MTPRMDDRLLAVPRTCSVLKFLRFLVEDCDATRDFLGPAREPRGRSRRSMRGFILATSFVVAPRCCSVVSSIPQSRQCFWQAAQRCRGPDGHESSWMHVDVPFRSGLPHKSFCAVTAIWSMSSSNCKCTPPGGIISSALQSTTTDSTAFSASLCSSPSSATLASCKVLAVGGAAAGAEATTLAAQSTSTKSSRDGNFDPQRRQKLLSGQKTLPQFLQYVRGGGRRSGYDAPKSCLLISFSALNAAIHRCRAGDIAGAFPFPVAKGASVSGASTSAMTSSSLCDSVSSSS
mmetsp:Transcript_86349/g.241481  ORF Transcript_86349/g.241481 Transcript_86349/m.241481 type:complete len:290 (-) Transcript_86349:347-1216(-)